MENHQQLFDGLLPICEEAGKAIMQLYQNEEIDIKTKGDSSPVTAADMAAHNIIQQGLHNLTPDIEQLSEEDPDKADRLKWERLWCIDPLDGTKAFINHTDEFTINIALIEENRPVLGFIYAPVSQIAYWGCMGKGAWKKLPNESPARIFSRPLPKDIVVAASHRHDPVAHDDLLKPVLDNFGQVDRKIMGSALKMCLIAEGIVDFYPRLKPTSEWDTAAGQAIIEASGGYLVNAYSLEPLSYNCRDTLENPAFFAYGDPQFPLEELQQTA